MALFRSLMFVMILVLFAPVAADDSVPVSETGILSDKIIFGQTAALQGPASALGIGMRHGILAAFKEANDNGGVHGRMLELVSYDDGYEPDVATLNTRKLIDTDKAFALIGGVGTPTSYAIEPIISGFKIPYIAPFTGAEFLRQPFKRHVVNLRASYWQETEKWIDFLAQDQGIKRIAILYQDDSYGYAGLSGVKRAMQKRGMQLVGEGTYKRNTTAIKMAVFDIRKSNPEAVVIVGAYKPAAEFIKLSKSLGFNPQFVNLSFVGSKALTHELGAMGEGVIVSQVVPAPYDNTSTPLIKRYRAALNAYDATIDLNFVSLEGYLAGRFAVHILESIDTLTRESFLDHIYDVKRFNIDGLKLNFGPGDNQGSDEVFMTVLGNDGYFHNIQNE